MTNIPHDLIDTLVGHSVSTVHDLGWAGTKNVALLKRASGVIDVLVTMDTNLEHQQNISVSPFGIVSGVAVFANQPGAVRVRRTSQALQPAAGEPARFGQTSGTRVAEHVADFLQRAPVSLGGGLQLLQDVTSRRRINRLATQALS